MCLFPRSRKRAYTPTPLARPPFITERWRSHDCDHDVFVCYVPTDRAVAERIVEALESGGARCWCAPRDLPPQSKWDEAIFKAIDSTCLVVAILSDEAANDDWFRREICHATLGDKIIIPFKLIDRELDDEMRFLLERYHYVDAAGKPLDEGIKYLCQRLWLDV